MRAFLDELRAAVTGLMQAPAFTALAVGVLGLGLGAVIFMYGVADTMMLKPPPYPQGDRIYSVVVIDGQAPGDYDDSLLPLDYLKVREAQTQFETFGSVYVGTTYLTGDGQAERYDGGFADGYIFAVPGIAPEIGRTIEPRDTIPGAARVIVLGHELWTERFGADPAVLGRTVRVNGQSSEVIGVMPKDYAFPTTADLWVANQEDPTRLKRGEAIDLNVFGRLKKDGNVDVAQQELAPVAAQIKTEVGADAFNGRFELKPFTEHWIGDDTKLIWTMLIAVGFVLLIACANVSNLLLARSAYRVRETTVRSALGASRSRLVAHMLAEGFVISALATVFGLLLASIALDGIELVVKRMMEDSPTVLVLRHRLPRDDRRGCRGIRFDAARRPPGGLACIAPVARFAPARRRPDGHGPRDRTDCLGPRRIRGRARMPAAWPVRAHDEGRPQRHEQRARRRNRRHHDGARRADGRHVP